MKKTLFSILLISNSVLASKVTTNLNLPKGKSYFSGEASFRSNELVENVGEVVGNKYYSNLDMKYDTAESSSIQKVFDLSARYNDQADLMYSIKEAKVVFNTTHGAFTVGRTILDWSTVDQEWGLGKLNNRKNFDYFEPGQEGLIGFLYEKKFQNNISVGAFGSILYVPESNPGMEIDEDNKTVTCKNPWCDAPSDSAEIEGKEIPIYYEVNYPEIADVVFRYSAGLSLGYEYKRLKLQGYMFRKPENSISVTAEIVYDTSNEEIIVEATPQFYYHDVKGTELTYSFSDTFKGYSSFISIDPNTFPDGNEPYLEYTGIKPKKLNEDYLGLGLKYTKNQFYGHLGYIARLSDFDRENELLVQYPRWNQAVQLQLKSRITRKLMAELDIKYDTITEDRLAIVKTNYNFTSNLSMALGVNIIGTSKDQESYWSTYENNDSVYSSLKLRF